MLLSKIFPDAKIDRDVDIVRITDKLDEVVENTLFVCITGKRFDGHKNAQKAYDSGAVAFIVERDMGLSNQIIFENSRVGYALAAAAFYEHPAEKLKLVGITGTNGKTSTALMLRTIFEASEIKTGLIGTLVNYDGEKEIEAGLTTPEYMELQKLLADMVENGCEYCIMEVSSQALSQHRVEGMNFEIGLFTNLSQDHLDYHGTMEEYAAAKAELFKMCKKGILNFDDEASKTMLENATCEAVGFSMNEPSNYRAQGVELSNNKIEYFLDRAAISISVAGEFNAYNTLGAIAAALECGIAFEQVVWAAKKIHGVKGRMEIVPTETEITVIIDYAHSPDSLENVLKAVRRFAEGKILTVFGCGGDRDKTKRPIMGKIAAELSDKVFVTSDNPRTENPDMIIEDILAGIENQKNVKADPDRKAAIADAIKAAKKGDIVLLCGKGHETYQILNTGKIHFDEREVVREIIANII